MPGVTDPTHGITHFVVGIPKDPSACSGQKPWEKFRVEIKRDALAALVTYLGGPMDARRFISLTKSGELIELAEGSSDPYVPIDLVVACDKAYPEGSYPPVDHHPGTNAVLAYGTRMWRLTTDPEIFAHGVHDLSANGPGDPPVDKAIAHLREHLKD